MADETRRLGHCSPVSLRHAHPVELPRYRTQLGPHVVGLFDVGSTIASARPIRLRLDRSDAARFYRVPDRFFCTCGHILYRQVLDDDDAVFRGHLLVALYTAPFPSPCLPTCNLATFRGGRALLRDPSDNARWQ